MLKILVTALYRYYGRGLEKTKSQKVRMTKLVEKRISKQLEEIVLGEDYDRANLFKILQKGFNLSQAGKSQVGPILSHFKSLFNFIDNEIFNKEDINHNPQKAYSVHQPILTKRYIEESKEKRKQKKTITLPLDEPEYFLPRLKEKYPNKSNDELMSICEDNIERIKKSFNECQDYFLGNSVRLITIEVQLKFFKRLLGWFDITNEVSIEELKLNSLGSVINPYVDPYNYDS